MACFTEASPEHLAWLVGRPFPRSGCGRPSPRPDRGAGRARRRPGRGRGRSLDARSTPPSSTTVRGWARGARARSPVEGRDLQIRGELVDVIEPWNAPARDGSCQRVRRPRGSARRRRQQCGRVPPSDQRRPAPGAARRRGARVRLRPAGRAAGVHRHDDVEASGDGCDLRVDVARTAPCSPAVAAPLQSTETVHPSETGPDQVAVTSTVA